MELKEANYCIYVCIKVGSVTLIYLHVDEFQIYWIDQVPLHRKIEAQ